MDLTPLELFSALSILLASLSSAAVNRMATQCNLANTVCFHLYNKTDLSSWQAAYDICLSNGETLASVPDMNTQTIMEKFTSVSLAQPSQPHAWLAGKRSDDNTWKSMDNNLFSAPVSKDPHGNMSCVTYYPTTKAFYSSACRQDTPYLNMFVCQYSTYQGCSDPGSLYIFPTCYIVRSQSVTSPIRTWNGANQKCQDLYPGGTLAYKDMYPDFEVRDYINRAVAASGELDPELWIGVRKKPWIWVQETSQGEVAEVPITYTRWWGQEGASIEEKCLHLDLNQNSAWADKDCVVFSQYFICQGQPAITTRKSTPSEGEESTTPTTVGPEPTYNQVTSESPEVPTTGQPTNPLQTPALTTKKKKVPTATLR